MEYYSVIKKREILPFAMTWMKLKGIMLSEMSDRDKLYDSTYIWSLTPPNSQTQRTEWWLPGPGGMGRGQSKVQTWRYKINKLQGSNIQPGDYSQQQRTVYLTMLFQQNSYVLTITTTTKMLPLCEGKDVLPDLVVVNISLYICVSNHHIAHLKFTRSCDFPGVQWLRFLAPNAGVEGSTPGQGTRSHMLQLRVQMSHPGTAKYIKN